MTSESNPLGIQCIDHLEFTCNDLNSPTRDLFYTYGFSKTYESPNKQKELFSQGQVRFLLNSEDSGLARDYLNKHGEGVSKMSFLVDDCEKALETAVKRGGKEVSNVQIISGLSTEIDFSLSTSSIEGEVVQVTAVKPLIQKDETSSVSTVSSEQLRNMPLSGTANTSSGSSSNNRPPRCYCCCFATGTAAAAAVAVAAVAAAAALLLPLPAAAAACASCCCCC